MAGNPQRRTTYLISLTLVKVEALPEDEAGDQKEALPEGEGSPNREEKKRKKKKRKEEKKEEAEEVEEAKEEEVASEAREVDEAPECKKEVATPSTPAKEEDEKFQVKVGSPLQSWRRPDRRDHQKSKDASSTSATSSARQMVKVYGGPTSEGTAVRREGPRSDAARPRTELYREPPALYPKGENGAELNSRSRCSLPFSVPPQVSGQRPDVLMRSHAAAAGAGNPPTCWRELRGEPAANASQYHSAKTLDARESREAPLGPYRASWADSDGRGTLIRPMGVPMGGGGFSGVMTRDSPQGERLRMVSISYPGPPVSDAGRPQRKGVSRTLDNSDLLYATEDLRRAKDQGLGQDGTIQRAAPPPPPRDRKMLKFISGIFNKSAAAGPPPPPNVSAAPFPAVERGSSEEEGEPTSASI